MSRVHRWALGCFAVLVIVGSSIEVAFSAETDLTGPRRVARQAEAKLLAGLHKTVKAEWSDVPIEGALESLAKTAGVPLWIDREALSADGIETDKMLVNLHLGETTVWQALHFLLKPFVLAWHGSDGLLSITTKVRAEEIQFTRTYDVAAMVDALELQVKKLPPRIRNDVGSWTNGTSGFFRVPESSERQTDAGFVLPQFAGGGIFPESFIPAGFGVSIGKNSVKGEELLAQMLVDMIPGKWEMTDGEGGTISTGRGRLIIRQAYQIHFLVRELLTAVEEFVVRGSKTKSVLIARPGYPHEEDATIFKRLTEPKDLDVTEAPLEEVLDKLSKEGRYRLWIDRESLTADGIATDTQVTLKLSGTTLDTLLHKLLNPLQLRIVVEEGTLIVTTHAKESEMTSMRVCFTGDIPEARGAEIAIALQEGTSGMWLNLDGEGGTDWSAVPDWIVIRQTQAVHREIAELFDDLRQAAIAPAAAKPPQTELRIYPVSDETAVGHLMEMLPTLVPGWDAKQGSITRLGQSLAIKQTTAIHEQLDDFFRALDQAHVKLNPPKPKEDPKPSPAAK